MEEYNSSKCNDFDFLKRGEKYRSTSDNDSWLVYCSVFFLIIVSRLIVIVYIYVRHQSLIQMQE